MRFKNKNILITGGNSGIGKVTAQRFIDEGATVIITGRNAKTLQETCDELGERCQSYAFDVSNIHEIEKNLKRIGQELKCIDVLFLNAGVTAPKPTSEVTEESFDRIMDTNVKGPFFTFQKALPFVARGGSVIATSSIAPLLGIKYSGVYAASKAALNRLMIAFSAEFLESHHIRFNIVSPGATHTAIFDERIKKDPNFLKKMSASIPMKRMGQPLEVADAVLFLASDEAKYISGGNLVIDGGCSSIFPWEDLQEHYMNKSSS